MAEPCPSCGSAVGPDHLCPGLSQKLVGTVLDGRYEVDSVIGLGGMGMVFQGMQTSVKRPVAIKTLHAQLAAAPQFFDRFRREAEIASRLHHPNIITIYDFGRTPDGTCYYVMELLTGESLKERVKRDGPLSLRHAVSVIEQAARGIGYAHHEGVIHRDIKPHNIMLENLNGAELVKVLDFGLVKALEADEPEQLTSIGQVLGTPQYMPPEQAGGEPVDQRSDLYSLGGVFYFCLTGTSPFGATTVRKALRAALTENLATVGSRRKGAAVPATLEAFFQKALAREKPDRFQDADEFVDRMHAAVEGLGDAEMDALPEGGGEVQLDPRTGDHSGPDSNTVRGRARGARTPTGQRTPSSVRAPTLSRARSIAVAKPPSASTVRTQSRTATRIAWVGVLILIGGVAIYRYRRSSAPSPPVPAQVALTTPALAEVPADVTVRLRSTPSGADVFEGAAQIGATPVDLKLSKDRVHSLSFRLKGYENAERVLDLSRLTQDATEVDVTLDPHTAAPVVGKKPKHPADIPVFE
jgi:serine/threonine protein kinase